MKPQFKTTKINEFFINPTLLESSLYIYSLLGRGEMPHLQLKSSKRILIPSS
jgi:hypothetical protein